MRIIYIVVDEWIKFQNPLGVEVDENIVTLIQYESSGELGDQIKQFATLFNTKNATYIKKVHRIILGRNIITKVIRTTANKLNQKEQIVLNRSTLLSCELDDLLR